jgi:hypothetical protein
MAYIALSKSAYVDLHQGTASILVEGWGTLILS